jgi:RNase P/RNase MRP subunit p30
MSQRIETAPATEPTASTSNEVLLRDIALRAVALGKSLSDATTMSPEDRANVLGELLDEWDHERNRIDTARDGAYLLAEQEALIEGAAE